MKNNDKTMKMQNSHKSSIIYSIFLISMFLMSSNSSLASESMILNPESEYFDSINAQNVYNLVPLDEITWLINYIETFEDEELNNLKLQLQSKVLEAISLSTDADKQADIVLSTKIGAFGEFDNGASLSYGIELPLSNSLIIILSSIFSMLSNIESINIGGAYNTIPTDIFNLLTIDSDIGLIGNNILYSELFDLFYDRNSNPTFRDYITEWNNRGLINKDAVFTFEQPKQYDPNYLNGENPDYSEFRGIYTYSPSMKDTPSTNDQNKFRVDSAIERPFSNAMIMEIANASLINKTTPESNLAYGAMIRNIEGNFSEYVQPNILYKSINGKMYPYLSYAYRLYLDSNTEYIFDFMPSEQSLLLNYASLWNRNSISAKILNGSFSVMEKGYKVKYLADGSEAISSYIENENYLTNDQWTLIKNFEIPLNQWIILDYHLPYQIYGETDSLLQFEVNVKPDSAPLDYSKSSGLIDCSLDSYGGLLFMGRDDLISSPNGVVDYVYPIHWKYNSINIVDANSESITYIDDWGVGTRNKNPFFTNENEDSATYSSIIYDSLSKSAPTLLFRYLNLMNLFILPNPRIHDVSEMLYEILLPYRDLEGINESISFDLTEDNFILSIDKSFFSQMLSPYLGEKVLNFTYYGNFSFGFVLEIDRNLGLLKKLEINMEHEHIPHKQSINIELISTKSPYSVWEGYNHFDQYSKEKTFIDKPYRSRFYNDIYADTIDLTYFPIDIEPVFQKTIDKIVENFDALSTIWSIIKSNPTYSVLTIGSLFSVSTLVNYMVIGNRMKKGFKFF